MKKSSRSNQKTRGSPDIVLLYSIGVGLVGWLPRKQNKGKR
jgi:hypothetical protein